MRELIDWQCNWKVWHWPWHRVESEYDRNVDQKRHWAVFGPFQFTWYSW